MERIQKAAVAMALAAALVTGVAHAEQKLGVEVYAGAQFLPAKSAYVKSAIGADASCYRTTDGAEAVTAYFARMPGFSSVERNVLRRGKVDVVVHPPAVDRKTGVASSYTVFCIMMATE